MSSIRDIVLCGFAACLALWPAQASAQTVASFNIPIGSAILDGAGASMSLSGIGLSSSGTNGFILNFVLPKDYVNNSEVLVVITLRSGTVSCSLRFGASQMKRWRTGQLEVTSLDGLTGPNPTFNVTSGSIFQKTFRINPGGLFADQKKGDVFLLNFARDADDPSDTCSGALVIGGIEVRYTAQ